MAVEPHPYGRVFTAGVGVAGGPVSDDWRAEEQDNLWFSAPPRRVSRGDHIFALGAGRRSAVLGLFEVTSGGPERLPSPDWDPTGRWPWAIGVRALAGVPPREGVSVPGVRAPRATASRVTDPEQQQALYDAINPHAGEPSGQLAGEPSEKPPTRREPDELDPGAVYSWEEVADTFAFKPAYLGLAGGMPVSAETDAVLTITHPGGGKSFDYADYWDGDDLIYTGRGKTGDQERSGANLDVAGNRRQIYAFEAAGPRQLTYLGSPTCVEERRGRAPGDDGVMRTVLQFRLRFSEDAGRRFAGSGPAGEPGVPHPDIPQRRSRVFDPAQPVPSVSPPTPPEPEEISALQEKALAGHADILRQLARLMETTGWSDVEEIPVAIDLWATAPGNFGRVIFEAKSISAHNELAQCRGALAQLLEYRLEYGTETDLVCLATNAEISLRRARLLDKLGVGVVTLTDGDCHGANDEGSRIAARLAPETSLSP